MSKISFLFKVVSIETFQIRNSQEGNEISKAWPTTGKFVQCFKRQEENGLFKETFEVRVCAFLAEHNHPLSLISPLVCLLKSTAPVNSKEVEVLKSIHLSTARCTNILRQGLGQGGTVFFKRTCADITRHLLQHNP